MRKRQLVARCVGIKVRRADFATFTRRRVVAPPTHDGRTIAKVANELLDRWLIENPGEKLRLLGVVLSDLSTASQLDLFENTPPHTSRLDAALDEARARFGSRALRRGSTIK
jgi:DNA polymerase-4